MLEMVGEPMFDNLENTLIVSGANGAYVQMNWQHIDFFAVQDKCPSGACDGEDE